MTASTGTRTTRLLGFSVIVGVVLIATPIA